MKKIVFIVPVYRNQDTLEELYSSVSTVTGIYQDVYKIEYLFVDDGSDDNSLEILLGIQRQNKSVNIIQLSRNFGQVPAIIAGLNEAEDASCVIILSADLQDPPELIPRMISAWENGIDIVIGHRLKRFDSAFDRISSAAFYKLMSFSNLNFPKGGFDFVLLNHPAVASLRNIDGRNRFLQGDILWLGFDIQLIPYDRRERATGKSQWKKTKKLKYLIDGVLSTSYWPIRLMSLLGAMVAFTGFFYAIVIVYVRIIDKTPYTGWAPIMILILILGGLIMLMLGLIGEYLWRIYDEVRGRPQYIIKGKYRES